MGDPSRVRLTGPLEAYGVGFARELTRLGYTRNSTADQLRLGASEPLAGGREARCGRAHSGRD